MLNESPFATNDVNLDYEVDFFFHLLCIDIFMSHDVLKALIFETLEFKSGDMGLTPGWGRPPGEGNGYPLQYSCPENSMNRGAWQAIVHQVAKSQTRLRDYHTHMRL